MSVHSSHLIGQFQFSPEQNCWKSWAFSALCLRAPSEKLRMGNNKPGLLALAHWALTQSWGLSKVKSIMELRKNQNAKSHQTGGKFVVIVLSHLSTGILRPEVEPGHGLWGLWGRHPVLPRVEESYCPQRIGQTFHFSFPFPAFFHILIPNQSHSYPVCVRYERQFISTNEYFLSTWLRMSS